MAWFQSIAGYYLYPKHLIENGCFTHFHPCEYDVYGVLVAGLYYVSLGMNQLPVISACSDCRFFVENQAWIPPPP